MAKEFKTRIKVSMDSTGVNKSVTEINRQMRVLDAEFKNISAQAKAFGSSTQELQAKQDALTKKIELQGQKVNQLKQQYEKAVQEKGKDAKETQNLAIKYNNAQKSLANMESSLKTTTDKIKEQTDKTAQLQTKLKDLSGVAGQMGQKMSSAGDSLMKFSAPIVAASGVMGKLAMDFESSMAKVSTIADESQVSIGDLGTAIRTMSDQTGKSTGELSEALYQTISAGVETGNAINVLGVATKVAIGGFTDTTTAIDGMTSMLNAYGLSAEKAIDISDQMFITQKFGKTSIDQLAQSLGQVAPLAYQAGLSTEELFGSVAALTRQGIQTSQAMTGIKAALSNIVKPSQQASELAEELGIKFSASALQSKGWTRFLEEVQRKTRGNTDEMATLFGSVEGLNSVLALTSQQGSKQFNQAMKEMQDSTGATEEAFTKMTDTTSHNWQQTMQRVKNAAEKAGKSLLPLVEAVLNILTPIATILGNLNPGLLQFIAIGGMMTLMLGSALKTFGSVATSISNITSLMTTLSPAALKTVGTIMLVVAALIALGAIIAVIMGKSKDMQQAFSSIGSGVNSLQPPTLQEPKIPNYAVHGSHANGLDYVPFDGYRAELHKGERVLTKEENKEYGSGNGIKGDTFIFNVDVNSIDDLVKYAQRVKQSKQLARAY